MSIAEVESLEEERAFAEELPLSYGQRALWFLERLAPGNPAYVIAGAGRLRGRVEPAALRRAAVALSARHPALRTTLHDGADGPVQRVGEAPRVDFVEADGRALAEPELLRRLSGAAFAPFDFERGPLWRLVLVRLDGGGYALALSIHHIVADFWSLAILVRELGALYGREMGLGLEPLLPLPAVGFAAVVAREAERLAGAEGERLQEYWHSALAGVPLVLDLPADRPRPRVQGYRGDWRPFRLPAGTVDRLRRRSRRQGATLYMALLAGFEALLGRYTGQERLIVGCPTTGRSAPELAGLVGYLVNPVAIAADLAGDPDGLELLERTRAAATAAFAHQGYPFALLAERLEPQRDPGRAPVIQALFVLQKGRRSGEQAIAALAVGKAGVRVAMGPLELESLALPDPGAQLDLSVMLAESGGELAGRLQYDRELFEAATIDRLGGHLAALLSALAAEPGLRVSALPLLSAGERAQLLTEWNDTAVARPAGPLVHERFATWARLRPEALALASPAGRLSYGDLAAAAGRLARRLLDIGGGVGIGAGAEMRVAVCAGLTLERVVGLLAVLAVGGAYVPLDPDSPPERLAFLLADCGAAVLLAERRLAGRLPATSLPVLYLEGALDEQEGPGSKPVGELPAARPVLPEDLAYIIYTSGSTGVPKGVSVPHSGLLNLVLWHQERYGVTREDRATQIASPAFDASVWELWPYLAAGASVHIPDPETRLSPRGLVHWWEREGITFSFLPTPLAESVLAESGLAEGGMPEMPEGRQGLRLRGLLCGGDRLHRAPPPGLPFPLLNHYGPSESSVVTTSAPVPPVPPVPAATPGLPPIGRPIDNTRALVLDAWGALAPLGIEGELAIGGAGLARGYLDRPELTAERFVPDPWSGDFGVRLYLTGDRVRRLADGSLDFLGRADHQVKVRGFRIELGEIESVLASAPGVSEAAVLVREDRPGDRRLVAYVVLAPEAGERAERSAALRRLGEALERRLPAYMVPHDFVVLESLPLSTNGKVDRRALASRPPEAAPGDSESIAPRTPLEARLAAIWAGVLGRERVGVLDNFFALGGHSLLATRLVSRVREALGVELPLRALFEAPTVAALASRIGQESQAGSTTPLVPRPRTGELPLSFAQERLWFLDRLQPGSAAYNIAGAVRLAGQLSVVALAAALAAIVERHEALRTTFRAGTGGPVQGIAPAAAAALPLPLVDLAALLSPDRKILDLHLASEEAARPFDLASGPLLRATLLRLAAEEHVLLLTLHHIVFDGWSLGVFVGELTALYTAALAGRSSPLSPLPIQYPDFAVWQRSWLTGAELERQLGWWRQRLAGAPATLDLATDRPRPPELSARGGAVPVVLPEATSAGLAALARGAEATLFMALLAGFTALLARYTSQEDLLVGSPIANRTRREVEGLIGLFVNTLVLRGELGGRPRFGDLVVRAREMALGAYAHQDLPFERLVEELQPVRDLSRSPLFQVLLVLQNNPARPLELPGLTLETAEVDPGTAKLDLQLTLAETAGRLTGALSFAADLFDPSTAERMAGHLAILLAGAVADPGRTLAELPLLAPAERAQLAAWNATATGYPEAGQTLPELFARQVAATPDAVAAVFAGEALTYAALAAQASALAARLNRFGVGPETVVGLCAERSLEMIVALLAIVEAGGAYLPLDPSYPAERLGFLLADAEVPVILAEERLLDRLPAHTAHLVLLGFGGAAQSVVQPRIQALPDGLAYVIFTSGSTGRPKGVMNSHRGIVNRLLWMQERYALTPADRVLQKTPYSFDVSVWEFFWPLLTGARLVFALPGGHQDSAYLARTIAQEGITVTHFVPSMLAAFLAEPEVERCVSLTRVLASGEALPPELARQFFARSGAELHNLYGPTEAAVDVTWWECEREPAGPGMPIGRPVANTQIHLLDPDGNPVPVGVPGELAIGGVQVARGYLGRPELTAERFVPDPSGAAPGGRLYRTGDLARRRIGGEVEYLGRLDHQVKLRGLRIELGEIESGLAAHLDVLAAVVVVREARPGDPRLLAYVVGRGGEEPSPAALRSHLGERLPEYMVPAHYVFLTALPLTASGKVDRRALPAPPESAWTGERREADRGPEGPRTPLEELVVSAWAEVLGLADGEPIGREESFFDLGGHSLLATQVISRLRESCGVELPLRRLFERPTVAGLAAAVEAARATGGALSPAPLVPIVPLSKVEREGDLPLSCAQERLWLLDQLEPGGFAYNLPAAVRLSGRLDRAAFAALAAGLGEIVRRHEALRTRFVWRGGRPVQTVLPMESAELFPLPLVDLSGLPENRRAALVSTLAQEDARLPFDLGRGALFRATLLGVSPAGDEHVLLLAMHHIVSDGWSLGVLLHELGALYEAAREGRPSPLPELSIQGVDFAVWQRARLAGGTLERELAWWRERLAGAPTVLELPADRPRPQVQRFLGGHYPFELPAPLAAEVRTWSRQSGATLFMTLLAAFQALLSRYTGQLDLLVGSPVAGRTHRELEGLIGFFVNTLVLRLDLSGRPGFRTLVERARETALGAYDHQELPFEKLVEALRPERHLSRAPFFQVLFALQNAPLGKLQLPGLELSPLAVESGIAKFDLTLAMRETAGGLAGVVEYDGELFEAVTAARLAHHFGNLLAAGLAAPELPLSELPLLAAAESQQLRQEWNDPTVDYPRQGLVPERVAAAVERAPDAVALLSLGERVSYGELAARAGRIARHLRRLGVGPESRVGIAVERSPLLVAALLGIWEAGGAYLPLDPSLPEERLAFMLADAGVELVLVDGRTAGIAAGVPVLAVEALWAAEPAGPVEPVPPPRPLFPGQAAYVIYTSGSTGRPKGVTVDHAALGNRMRFVEAAEIAPGDSFLHKTTLLFDASIGEIWSPLVAGAATLLAAPGEERDPARLVELIELCGATLASFTPSLLRALLLERSLLRCRSLRVVLTGGEVVAPELAALFHAQSAAELYNRYGPTEATISVTSWRSVRGELGRTLPIGRPIARTEVYILDPDGALLPAGVPGELCLGGPGLARGYHDRPDLTAERFVPHPWPAGPGAAGERLYRTGDLARCRADGAVEFVGRLDGQVKIRGFRVELGEIEAALLEHPAVDRAVVIARADPTTGSERLVAYAVLRGGPGAATWPELALHLARTLPAHMVPAAWVGLPELPLSPTGKVDRRALPEPEIETGPAGERPVPSGPMEELVAGIWSDLLGLPQLGREDSFFDLGGHSLLATQVVSRVRDALRVEIPLRRLFEAPTVAGFAAAIEAAGRVLPAEIGETAETAETGIRPLPGLRGAFPLSFAQERLWFLDQLQPGSALYNVPGAVRFTGRLDPALLRAALTALVERHEALRTTFWRDGIDGGAAQRIGPPFAPALPVIDLRGLADRVREAAVRRLAVEEARRPFDLAAGPLLRTTLVRLGEEDCVALFTLHHIVSDGWSMGVFVRELAAAYGALGAGEPVPLPPLPVQYADFSVWQRERLSGPVLERQIAWWKERLAGAPVGLELPADRPRPPLPSYRGGQVPFELPAGLWAALGRLGRRQTATPFMVLLATFETLLARITGQLDLLVGTPVANRTYREIEGLIGFFVNTLVLRGELAGQPRFLDLVAAAREMTLGAYAHQDLPFERLVEELQPARDLSRSSLVQVTLVLQNLPAAPRSLPGLGVEPFAMAGAVANFDLQLIFQEVGGGAAGAGGGMLGTFVYAADLFDRTTALRWAGQFSTLLAAVVAAVPGAELRLTDLPLLAAAERHQLLAEWNDTAPAERRPPPPHVLTAFAAQAERTPDRIALVADLSGPELVTYAELDRRSAILARRLLQAGVGPEAPVGVCLPRSADLVAALLALWKAGGAYLPLDPAYPRERLALLLADSGADTVLTLDRLTASLPGDGVRLVRVDEIVAPGDEGPDLPPVSGPERLAYLIYTSGSTGRPKGVLVEHGNLAHLLAAARTELGFGGECGEEAMPCVAPFSFDIFFFELLAPLLSGGTVLLVPLVPTLDVEALVEQLPRMTRLHAVPALMRQIVERVQSSGLACPGLRTAFVGGDAVPVELLIDLRRAFPRAELRVLYGPTEGTIVASSWRVAPGERPERSLLGRPLPGTTLVPRDPWGNPVPVGVAGEIWLGGAGVARGYLHREELTATAFPTLAGERYYRSGDLARRLPDGTLEFLGRGDGQVKIRGFRIELGEVEAALGQHPGVREVVVLAREDRPGDRRLVAYVVGAGNPPPAAALRAFLKDRLPEYMTPAAFLFLAALPLSAHGKVDRRALPAPEQVPEESAHIGAPRTPWEEILVGIFAEVLGVTAVGVEEDFFALGGHSLLATRVVSRVRQALEVELPVRALFDAPTVAELARLAERARASAAGTGAALAPPLVRRERQGAPPLSFGQERLWFLEQLEPGGVAYLMPLAVRFHGRLDPAALAGSLSRLVERHESLRTTFATAASGGGEMRPVQVIGPARPVELPRLDLTALPSAEREAELRRLARDEARRPLDLRTGPLLRTALAALGADEHVALFTLHHIASDGWSMDVFVRELAAGYGALVTGEHPALTPLPLQYADYAIWQREWLSGEVLAGEIAWWQARLAGAPGLLELPTDRPRPAVQRYRASELPFLLPTELSAALERQARRQGATPFMLLLAALAALLGRWSGQEEVVVGSPIANRNRAETENLIGLFINTLALRASLAGDPTPGALVARLREVTLAAYGHQDLPFEKLVEALQPERSLAHAPVFQVLLVLQNGPRQMQSLPGLRMETLAVAPAVTKFDLTLALRATPEGLAGVWEYDRDLFDAPTVARLAGGFERLLAAFSGDTEAPISEVLLLSAAERQELLEWSSGGAIEPSGELSDTCLHELFLAQAERTPEAAALLCGDLRLTYGELAARVRQLAGNLAALGVGPEVRVGVCLARTAALPVALLAVLAAGGAYVPLDPAYPQERLRLMLEDSAAALLLTAADLVQRLPEAGCPRLLLTPSGLPVDDLPTAPLVPALPGSLAYLIYTSGSTGKPKGVAIEHRSAVALALWARQAFSAAELSGVLFATSVSFDLSVFELFVPLAWGGRVILAENALALPALAAAGEVTLVNTVPSALTELLRQRALPPSVRTVNLAGEPLPRPLVDALYALVTVARVWNLYGPSEDTTYSTAALQEPAGERPPGIGRPLAGTRAHVLDRAGRPVPVGVSGELHLGGAGLARGYLGRPELTAERFVPDPLTVGERLYRTGDLVRLLPGGELHFLGRLDHQVKIRGFRIELGEIEALLGRHPAVREAVVLAREDRPGDRRLAAYVVFADADADAGGRMAGEELRPFLAERLPEYMVPAVFVVLPALPLSPNGKVDRRALPAPEWRTESVFAPPEGAVEAVLAGMWEEVLGVPRVGRHDGFFRLGGHSLLGMELVSRVRGTFKVELPLRRLFETPTVAALAAAIVEGEATAGQSAKIARVLLRLRQMSPGERRGRVS